MFKKKPMTIECRSGEAVPVGNALFLPCTRKEEGTQLMYKVAKGKDPSKFLGTAYEGSPGFTIPVGTKVQGVKGYTLTELRDNTDEDGNRKPGFTAVLTKN